MFDKIKLHSVIVIVGLNVKYMLYIVNIFLYYSRKLKLSMVNMQLFIMRHGQASSEYSEDSQRKLIKQGCTEVSAMASWLSESRIEFGHILVSPYIRAQQTANLIKVQSSPSSLLTTVDLITPSGDAKQVHDYIDGYLQNITINDLLIVSHMPLVSYLVAELTFDKVSPIFQTAGIAQIDYNRKTMSGELVNFVAPYDVWQ